jgi:hypothetical protein
VHVAVGLELGSNRHTSDRHTHLFGE